MPRTEWAAVYRGANYSGERGLFPVDAIAMEGLHRVGKNGTQTLVATRSPRNLKQLRQFWALCSIIADNVEGIHDREDAAFFLKVKARHGHWVMDPDTGETWFRVDSISFDALPQEEFAVFYERFIAITCTEIVPGLDAEAVKKQILEVVAGELGRRAARGGRGDPDK